MGDSVKKSEAMAIGSDKFQLLLLIPEAAEAVKQLIPVRHGRQEKVL